MLYFNSYLLYGTLLFSQYQLYFFRIQRQVCWLYQLYVLVSYIVYCNIVILCGSY